MLTRYYDHMHIALCECVCVCVCVCLCIQIDFSHLKSNWSLCKWSVLVCLGMKPSKAKRFNTGFLLKSNIGRDAFKTVWSSIPFLNVSSWDDQH